MTRCPVCGGFYDGAKCPNPHVAADAFVAAEEELPPTAPVAAPRIGTVVVYNWPTSGLVNCMVTSELDDQGRVGLMVLNEHVRVSVDDLEEI